MKKTLLTLLAATVVSGCWAISRQALIAYATSLSGKSGAELKAALHTIMQPEVIYSYGKGENSTWWGFYTTDRDAETNECYNRYSSDKFYFSSQGASITGMNIEHSFPKSWWGGAQNNAYKDLYNLYPSDASANSSKSNYAMGVVETVRTEEEGYDKVGWGTINGKDTLCWEPGDQYKGDFARSYMYMAIVYSNLTFVKTGLQTMENSDYPGMRPWATTLYIAWGKGDAVSKLERDRNNAVAKIEKNRNLLVDYPYLADYIWGDSTSVAFDPATSVTTADDDDRYMETQPVEPDEPQQPDDNIKFVKASSVEAGARYLIVANSNGTLYAAKPINNGSKTYGYLYVNRVTELNDTISLATDTISYAFEATDGGWLLKDNKGRYYYHSGTYPNYNYSTSAADGSVWTVTPQSDGTFMIAASDGYYMQYAASYSSYGCYNTSKGILPMLYRLATETTDAITTTGTGTTELPRTVYNLQGQAVGQSLEGLPAGIYILGGKKILVR